jgi:ribonuclease HI
MWVTLYSDASFNGREGSWAIWLRSEKGRIVKSGKCPVAVDDNNAAEMYAALVGITVALRDWGPLTGIQVNSDNQVVCTSLYSWSKENRHPTILRIQTKIRQIVAESGVRIRTKHVRGHQRSDHTRAWLNNRCDRMARKASREPRAPELGESHDAE